MALSVHPSSWRIIMLKKTLQQNGINHVWANSRRGKGVGGFIFNVKGRKYPCIQYIHGVSSLNIPWYFLIIYRCICFREGWWKQNLFYDLFKVWLKLAQCFHLKLIDCLIENCTIVLVSFEKFLDRCNLKSVASL